MMYTISYSRSSLKYLKKEKDKNLLKSLKETLSNLKSDPFPNGYKKLKGHEFYRVRVSNIRIIYSVNNDELYIEVVRISHRKEVYNNL